MFDIIEDFIIVKAQSTDVGQHCVSDKVPMEGEDRHRAKQGSWTRHGQEMDHPLAHKKGASGHGGRKEPGQPARRQEGRQADGRVQTERTRGRGAAPEGRRGCS